MIIYLIICVFNYFSSQMSVYMLNEGEKRATHLTAFSFCTMIKYLVVGPPNCDCLSTFLQIPNWFDEESSKSTRHNPFPLPEVYMSSQQRNVSRFTMLILERLLQFTMKTATPYFFFPASEFRGD